MRRRHRAVVLLHAAAGEGGARRPPQPHHRLRLLEGDGIAELRVLVGEQGDRSEEEHGVLQGEGSHREEDQVEDE